MCVCVCEVRLTHWQLVAGEQLLGWPEGSVWKDAYTNTQFKTIHRACLKETHMYITVRELHIVVCREFTVHTHTESYI